MDPSNECCGDAGAFGDECGDIDPSNECCGDAGAFGDEGGDTDPSNECFGDVIAFGDEGAGDIGLSGAGSNSPDPFGMAATSSAGPISKSSEDEIENGTDEIYLSDYPVPVHFRDV
ncbi:hypothetical protein BGY98DRAFT_1101039 [Russula aff. rugulosa BPL654]|nr:hypothetical protein BGY98DRAFT_1101039 [Russula aff. rugulosa BPL654]